MSTDDDEKTAHMLAEVEAQLGGEPTLCAPLRKIAKRLHRSKHPLMQSDAKVLDFFVSGRPLAAPATDQILTGIMTALGRHIPDTCWPVARNFAARSIGDAARTETARLAYEAGRASKAKWSRKKRAAKEQRLAEGRAVLVQLQKRGTDGR